jgi:WD40 repeat protein
VFSPIRSVAFFPDGERLVTGGDDGIARIWEISSGQEVASVEHGGGEVIGVAFSPNGELVATAGSDGTARIWEISSGEEVARVEHAGGVTAVAFSRDGARLATASEDNTAEVWYLRPEALIREACSRLTRNLSRDEWRTYLGDIPYRKTCPNLPEPA